MQQGNRYDPANIFQHALLPAAVLFNFPRVQINDLNRDQHAEQEFQKQQASLRIKNHHHPQSHDRRGHTRRNRY